ncbi:MAG: hypothetical protein HY289_04915, partial [Planctomycetes bacterium]|nr:hypothetical protein [Planctomycetota bacterium]
ERQGNFSVLGGTLRANDAGINLATLNGPAVADTTVQANVSIAANQAVGLVGRYQANGSFYFGAIVADNTGTNCTAYIFAYIAGLGYFQINTAAPSIAGTNGVLRFQLVGSSLRLYFGADTAHLTLIASTQDTTIAAAGVVGVRTTKNVVIDNFTAG